MVPKESVSQVVTNRIPSTMGGSVGPFVVPIEQHGRWGQFECMSNILPAEDAPRGLSNSGWLVEVPDDLPDSGSRKVVSNSLKRQTGNVVNDAIPAGSLGVIKGLIRDGQQRFRLE